MISGAMRCKSGAWKRSLLALLLFGSTNGATVNGSSNGGREDEAGNRHESGCVVEVPDGAGLKTFLHFKQVIPRDEEKQPAADPPDKEGAKPKR